MSKQLVQQILNHPNSAFGAADEAWMLNAPQDALTRILLSLETAAVTTYNADPASTLRADLAACQDDLKHCMTEEQRILNELAMMGVQERSVIMQTGVMTVNADSLSDPVVYEYLTKKRTPLTTIVNEGMVARNDTRRKCIDAILHNSGGIYTIPELDAKSNVDLQKLMSALQTQRSTSQQWAGAAFADHTMPGVVGVPQYTQNEADCEPLEPPKFW